MKKDLIVSLVFLAGIVSLYLSLGFMDDPRAANFPKVIIIIMGILSALMLLQTVFLKQPTSSKGAGFPFGRFLITFFMIIIYFFLMEGIGFYLSAFLFFIAVTFILGSKDLNFRTGSFRVVMAFALPAFCFSCSKSFWWFKPPKGCSCKLLQSKKNAFRRLG